ncbi:T6SS immunity protein Tli4 family protein, partial [Escherichia coli]
SLSDREKEMVTSLLQHPEMRYFGFYSVALPAEFTPTGMVMFIQGSEMTPVETKLQYYPPFQQFLLRYEKELRNKPVADPQDAPYLKGVYPLTSPMSGLIFERVESGDTPDFARILDAWKWAEGVTFSVKMNVTDRRPARYDVDRKGSPGIYSYDVPQKKAQLLAILSGLQPRRDNQRPSGNKLAIQYGQVDASLLGEYEVSVSYKNSNNIEISLQTDTDSYITSLLDENAQVMETADGITLYKGQKKINGLEISEWWVRKQIMLSSEPSRDYEFSLAIHEDKKNNKQLLKLVMNYSIDLLHADNALTEHELVALWENITGTIKYHPTQW